MRENSKLQLQMKVKLQNAKRGCKPGGELRIDSIS